MLAVRGFNVDVLLAEGSHDVRTMVANETLNFNLLHPEGGQRVYVHFVLEVSRAVRPDDINKLVKGDYAEVLKPTDTLIVVSHRATSTLSNALKAIWTDRKLFIQAFLIEELQFDITTHTRWLPHRVLTQKEQEDIKKRYTSLGVLPILSREDAAARWIGLRPGQVCEVQRKSETAGIAIVYRLCMNELPSET